MPREEVVQIIGPKPPKAKSPSNLIETGGGQQKILLKTHMMWSEPYLTIKVAW